MAADEEVTEGERETLELVESLVATGNLHALIVRLRAGDTGPERARDALTVLGDLDLRLLVQLTLDTLVDQYVEDPGLAHQTRRETRSEESPPGG